MLKASEGILNNQTKLIINNNFDELPDSDGANSATTRSLRGALHESSAATVELGGSIVVEE